MENKKNLNASYELSLKTKETLNNTLLSSIGISYDEFIELDFLEQQGIIREYHKKNSKSKGRDTLVMLGNGEHATFRKMEKGDVVMIGSGEHSCFVEAGLTIEEASRRLDDKIDDIIYSKPVALVKKIGRRIKND